MRRLFTEGTIRWRNGSEDRGGVLSDLVDKYSSWVQQMLNQYDEMPFGHTEWTVTGHLAGAARKLGYYFLQEYPIEPKVCHVKVSERLRPDLYLKEYRNDYVFEVKLVWIKLGYNKADIERIIKAPLRQARDKLYRYLGEAKYRCSMVVAPIYVKNNDWEDYYHIRNLYSKAKTGLRDDLDSLLLTLPRSTVNYCGGFLCVHQEAMNEYKKARNEGWDEPAIGFIFLGRIIRPGHRGR